MPSIDTRTAPEAMHPIVAAYPLAGPQAGHFAIDHYALRREATGLLVLAEHGGPLDRALSDTFVERLSRLCGHLREHFALEEEDGYLREVIAQRPGLLSRAASLQRQHATFLAEGATLAQQLLGARAPHDTIPRLVRLLEALRRHEFAEHDLFQQAFLDDLGSGD